MPVVEKPSPVPIVTLLKPPLPLPCKMLVPLVTGAYKLDNEGMSAATKDLKAGVVADPVVGPANTVLAS